MGLASWKNQSVYRPGLTPYSGGQEEAIIYASEGPHADLLAWPPGLSP